MSTVVFCTSYWELKRSCQHVVGIMAFIFYALTFRGTPIFGLRFGGDNTFDANEAHDGGAIFNEPDASISLPRDGGGLIFKNLRGEVGRFDGVSVCTIHYYGSCTLFQGVRCASGTT